VQVFDDLSRGQIYFFQHGRILDNKKAP